MENKKIFIGNLDFEVTESELKNFVSKYGTVVSIKMHQKRGYAIIGMNDSEEAEKSVQKLNGMKFKNREMRVSLEMKAGKAKSVSVKRYKERGESFSKERTVNNSDPGTPDGKYRSKRGVKSANRSLNKEKAADDGMIKKSGFEYSGKKMRSEQINSGDSRSEKKEWSSDYRRDENRESYGSYKRSFERLLEKTNKQRAGSDYRHIKDYAKENTYNTDNPEKGRPYDKDTSKKRFSGNSQKSGEKFDSPKHSRENSSAEKSSRNQDRKKGNWKEKQNRNDYPGDKTADYSKKRTLNNSKNERSRTSDQKSELRNKRTESNGQRQKFKKENERNTRSE